MTEGGPNNCDGEAVENQQQSQPNQAPESWSPREVNTAQANSDLDKPSWVEVATLVVLIFTLAAAVYAGVEANRLAIDTETALSDARDNNKTVHSDNVAALAQAARDSRDALAKSDEANVLSMRAMTAANRAWVSTTLPGFNFFPAQMIGEFSIGITDIGVQPATEISSYIEAFSYDPIPGRGPQGQMSDQHFEPNHTCRKLGQESDVGVIWPKEKPLRLNAVEKIHIDPAVFSAKKWYGVRGCIGYATMGTHHQTAFCYFSESIAGVPFEKWNWSLCTGKGQQYAN